MIAQHPRKHNKRNSKIKYVVVGVSPRLHIDMIKLTGSMQQIDVINPATEEVIGSVPRRTADDADRAVDAAREAFRKWRWIPAIERASMLHKIAAGIRSRQH